MKNSLFQRRQAAVMIAGMMLMSVAVPVLACVFQPIVDGISG